MMRGREVSLGKLLSPLLQPPFLSSFGRERMGVGRDLTLTPACTPSLFRNSNGGWVDLGVLG